MLAYCSGTEHEEDCKYPLEEGYALFIENDLKSYIYNKNTSKWCVYYIIFG